MKKLGELQSEPTVKDVHSPAGQTFYAPPSFADLPDCPKCKYGTPVTRDGKEICIDCGFVVKKSLTNPAMQPLKNKEK